MGTPTAQRKTVDLTKDAELVRLYRQACEDEKKLKAYKDRLGVQLRRKMGKAEVAEVAGVPVFTYVATDSYAWARFVEEHGAIADQYLRPVQKMELDKDRLLEDHGGLLAQFRSRQFLVK